MVSRVAMGLSLVLGAIAPAVCAAAPAEPLPVQAFLRALTAPGSTSEQRRKAWGRLSEAGKRPSRAVADAVARIRAKAWRSMAQLVASGAVRKGGLGLRKALAPHQEKARNTVRGGGFSKAKLDEAMAPIGKALNEAIGPLRGSDAYKKVHATIDEMEGYAVACGLRVGWSDELSENLCTVVFVNRYAGAPRWTETLELNRRVGSWIAPGEHACIARLNVHRILIGLHPVGIDLRLVVAAKKHSEEMVAKKYFSHASPTPHLKGFGQRAGREHTRAGGECIAAGSGSGVGVFRMWYYSQGHHRIMIGGARHIGVGRAARMWTLMTGGSQMAGSTAGKMAQYVRGRYQAGDDPARLFALAKWCGDASLLTQAEDELERVLALDPKHPEAARVLERLRSRTR